MDGEDLQSFVMMLVGLGFFLTVVKLCLNTDENRFWRDNIGKKLLSRLIDDSDQTPSNKHRRRS